MVEDDMEQGDETQVRPAVYLVSSCLVGLLCRYDGANKPSDACRRELAGKIWIPVCPEQLGGLPTPRTPAELVDGQGDGVLAGTARVVDRDGVEVTEQFLCGARQVLEIAELQQVAGAYLKSGSPSCGSEKVLGVTAALLKSRGIPVKEF
jgi:uncharacterized protein YbbK (DUF523 family)